MRARKKKNTVPRLEKCKDYITDKIVLSETKPLHVEIGCGKGMFITGMAQTFDYNFYAMEKVPDVIVMAIEKAAEKQIPNLKFIINDADHILDICPLNSVDVLYLNFSDPWPKNRDIERRLTYRGFLTKYKQILKENGIISLKTDNIKLFDFSKIEFEESGFELFDVTTDINNSDIGNPFKTEYETRFIKQGLSINHLKAKIKKL
ncbi:MAG: trmB [Clostridia bacterium]|nr:trmB [Clostridia bacterium]